MKHWVQSAALAAGVLSACAAHAQSSNPAWIDDLKLQMQSLHQCKVSYYLNIRERPEAGKIYYEARVQCEDGRMFDAIRPSGTSAFKVTPCARTVC